LVVGDAVDEALRVWIEDGDLAVGGVDPVGEIAVVEFARGDGKEGGRTLAVAEALLGDEEEAFIFAVVGFSDRDRAADGGSEVVLLQDGAGSFGAEFLVTEELEGVAVEFVGVAFGDEGHESAEGEVVIAVVGGFGFGRGGRDRRGLRILPETTSGSEATSFLATEVWIFASSS
jgi:hypothetical protein